MALGGVRPVDGSGETRAYGMACDHLPTHGVVVGMTGSGKSGLLMVLVSTGHTRPCYPTKYTIERFSIQISRARLSAYKVDMATLCEAQTGREVRIRSRTLLGRSPRADVVLSSMGASSEHAMICWDGEDWSLRDLKSRNGTWINNSPLTGRTWRLAPGDRLAFGDQRECWIWLEGAGPCAAAVSSKGVRIEASEHLLCLPDNHAPEVLVYLGDSGWVIEREGLTQPLNDRDSVHVGSDEFCLELPEIDARGNRTRTVVSTRDIRTARAIFSVSSDEEHVELTLEIANQARPLPVHAFYYMLLILARARIADIASGVGVEDAGWVYVDELTHQLAMDSTRLNVDVCRARKLVDDLRWFSNPEELVQRRKPTKQLRIGCARLEIRGANDTPAG